MCLTKRQLEPWSLIVTHALLPERILKCFLASVRSAAPRRRVWRVRVPEHEGPLPQVSLTLTVPPVEAFLDELDTDTDERSGATGGGWTGGAGAGAGVGVVVG